ncbi:PABIR family member 1 [Lemmus lemmus]
MLRDPAPRAPQRRDGAFCSLAPARPQDSEKGSALCATTAQLLSLIGSNDLRDPLECKLNSTICRLFCLPRFRNGSLHRASSSASCRPLGVAHAPGSRSNGPAVSMDEDSDVFLNQQEPDTLQNFQLSSGFVLNTDVAKEKMEVDLSLPSDSTTVNASLFRRSRSIPLVNGFGDNSQGLQVDTLRIRRNGSPFLNRHALGNAYCNADKSELGNQSNSGKMELEDQPSKICKHYHLTPSLILPTVNKMFGKAIPGRLAPAILSPPPISSQLLSGGDWLNCRKGEDSVTPNRVVDRLLSRSPPGNVRRRVVPGAVSPGQLNSARKAAGGLRGCLRPGRGSYTSAGPTLLKGHQQAESGGPTAWSQPPTTVRHRSALLSVTEPSSGCGSRALSTRGGGGSAT